MKTVRVGTRVSNLAMIQAKFVEKLLIQKGYEVEIVGMKTKGDMILDKPLAEIGDKGLFTKELETALLENKIDCIVHSFKDVPTNLPCETLVISGVLKRQNPLDALVVSDRLDAKFKNVENLDQFFELCETEGKLPVSIGTSSLRRRAQLKARYNDKVKISDIRGNLNTRLRKLDSPKEEEPKFDAIVLATAGLERLGVEFHERITVRIVPEDMLYAVGQAALAIESRADDSECLTIIQSISDEVSNFETICERACMRTLEGGCHVPIGVNTVRDEAGKMTVTCAVFSIDGTKTASVTQSCSIVEVNKQTSGLIHGTFCDNFEQGTAIDKMGSDMADKLLIAGAKEILNPTVE